MKAMILAAGKGTRIRPITYTIPKPMIPILQKPVMEFLLELLRQHGVEEVMVNVSHLAQEIESYFRDGQRFGVQIAYSFEGHISEGELIGQALGSAGGMKRIQDFNPFFDSTFVVLCGDALIDLDLTEAVRWHKQKGALATVVMKTVPREEVSSYGVVVTDEDGRIQAFQEKPSVEEALSTNINTGIYIFEPEVLDYIPSGVEFDIGSDLFPLLVQKGAPFYGISMDFEWIDIGKVPDYWQAIRSVLQGEVRNVSIPGQQILPGLFTGINVAANWDRVHIEGPVYIGGMTQIEDGARIIGPAMIGPNCHICSGATVDNSVIFEYSRLGSGVTLVDKLVFGRYCVDKSGAAIDVQGAGLDWLITDTRRVTPVEPSAEHRAIAELLGRDALLHNGGGGKLPDMGLKVS
jgi:mannose-1-phosphate guanylyltransferase